MKADVIRFFVVGLLISLLQKVSIGQSVQFNNLSIKEGLSQNTVTAIMQDDRGFIWAGTRDGLNRYDGRSFVVFRHDKSDSTTLSNNSITSLLQSNDGHIWIGTAFGLNRLNARTLSVQTYFHWFEDSLSISSNTITSLIQDREGILWIGTDNGLNRMSQDGKFTHYVIEEENEKSLPGKVVKDMALGPNGGLWIATESGLALYEPDSDSFKRFQTEFRDDNSLSNNNVLCLTKGVDGILWIGTRDGLNKLNVNDTIFTRYYSDYPRRDYLTSNIILTILEEENGDTWIGTPSGISLISSIPGRSDRFRHEPNRINSLPNDFVTDLLIDNAGMIWIGTESAGLATLNRELPQFNSVNYSGSNGFEPERNRINAFTTLSDKELIIATGKGLGLFNTQTGESTFKSNGKQNPVNLSDYHALDVEIVKDSLLWVATLADGIWKYEIQSDILTKYQVGDELTGLSSNRINSIQPDGQGNLWLGTSGGGLSFWNSSSERFNTFRFDGNDPNSIRDNNILSLALCSDSILFVGTGNAGLYEFNQKVGNFVGRLHVEGSNFSLPSNTINSIFIDPDHVAWIGTDGGGLVRYDRSRDSLRVFNTSDGLGNNVVHAITMDDFGVLWFSTNAGISAFNNETQTFRNYTEQAVLGRNTFLRGSACYDKNGILFFGGSNGFDFFNSNGLKENRFRPDMAVVGMELFEASASDSVRTPLRAIPDTLILEPNFSGLSFEFAALSFKQSEKNQYAYRLEGLVDEWQYIGTRNFVDFTSLNPGWYTFEVIGSNNDGFWTEEPAVIKVHVKPAFWETTAFRLFVIIVVLTGLYLAYRYRIAAEKARTKELEFAVGERTKEIAKERDTNATLLREIHHRVKNNLQIIVSLLSLQSRFIQDDRMMKVFSEIQNRIHSMSLIHQKMYKTEDLASMDINDYVIDLVQNLLNTYSLDQDVSLEIDVSVKSLHTDTLTPLGLIINEIISNSLKYAFVDDRSGKITVKLHPLESGKYLLELGDDGVGLPSGNETEKETFGSELIQALSEQLNGELVHLKDRKGTNYRLEFEDVGS